MIMIRILLLNFFIFFMFSCTPKNVNSFYIVHRHSIASEKDVFKLSLEEKRVHELQKIIENFNSITAKTLGNSTDIDYNPDTFSEYVLVGKDKSGEKIIDCYFVKNQPFSLYYLTKESSNSAFNGNKYIKMKFYSIENFFSKEEKQKMKLLIPSWKEKKEL